MSKAFENFFTRNLHEYEEYCLSNLKTFSLVFFSFVVYLEKSVVNKNKHFTIFHLKLPFLNLVTANRIIAVQLFRKFRDVSIKISMSICKLKNPNEEQNFTKNEHFLPPDTHTKVYAQGVRNVHLSENFAYERTLSSANTTRMNRNRVGIHRSKLGYMQAPILDNKQRNLDTLDTLFSLSLSSVLRNIYNLK